LTCITVYVNPLTYSSAVILLTLELLLVNEHEITDRK
jgi:hypothetical protein